METKSEPDTIDMLYDRTNGPPICGSTSLMNHAETLLGPNDPVYPCLLLLTDGVLVISAKPAQVSSDSSWIFLGRGHQALMTYTLFEVVVATKADP
jgi:hypothetical protein